MSVIRASVGTGLCRDHQEYVLHVGGAAVPIERHDGTLYGALSVAAPDVRVESDGAAKGGSAAARRRTRAGAGVALMPDFSVTRRHRRLPLLAHRDEMGCLLLRSARGGKPEEICSVCDLSILTPSRHRREDFAAMHRRAYVLDVASSEGNSSGGDLGISLRPDRAAGEPCSRRGRSARCPTR